LILSYLTIEIQVILFNLHTQRTNIVSYIITYSRNKNVGKQYRFKTDIQMSAIVSNWS